MKSFLYSIIAYIILVPIFSFIGHTFHTTKTQYGECIGLVEQELPNLVYKYNKENLILTILLTPFIITPAEIIHDDIFCPVGIK